TAGESGWISFPSNRLLPVVATCLVRTQQHTHVKTVPFVWAKRLHLVDLVVAGFGQRYAILVIVGVENETSVAIGVVTLHAFHRVRASVFAEVVAKVVALLANRAVLAGSDECGQV